MAEMTPVSNPIKKIKLSPRPRDEIWIASASRDELIDRVIKQQIELEASTSRRSNDNSLEELRETVEKLKHQIAENATQESRMVLRLASKEKELQRALTLNQEMKVSRNPSLIQLQSMLLDPTVNLMFQHMKQEMDASKSKLEQAQSELAAWKFTPDSQAGKRLMAKCRMLLQENEDLGKAVSAGKIAKLEGDIALQKKLILEMKKSETDTEEFLGEMDEDTEQMQGTIYLLQQELKETKERLTKYEHHPSTTTTATQPAAQPTTIATTCNGDAPCRNDDLGRTGGIIFKQIKTEIVDDVGLNTDSHQDQSSEDQNNVPSSDATICNHSNTTDVVTLVTSVVGQNDRGGDNLIGKIVTCRSSSTVVNCTSRTTAADKVKTDDNNSMENGSTDCGYGMADSPGQVRHRATVGNLDAYRAS